MADSVEGRRTGRAWLRLAVLTLAVAYPVALVLVLLALRGIGEGRSVTTLALYLPRAGFGLPLPFLTLALLFIKPRRWLLTQLGAAALLLFPLMGLKLHAARTPTAGAPRLRVMSFNIDSAPTSSTALVDALRATAAEVICLQEAEVYGARRLAKQLPGWIVRGDGQFIVASKHPIVDVYVPPPLGEDLDEPGANFVRYRIDAPGGLIDVYSMHPISPHRSFDRLRGGGLRGELLSGRFFVNRKAFWHLSRNADVRGSQVAAVARHAATAPYPVLIMGDTNLPSGSPVLARELGGYQDGFTTAGRGFGYSYPVKSRLTWLRLDRIMADRSFRFVSFSRLDVRLSTHFPVVADLERVPPTGGAR